MMRLQGDALERFDFSTLLPTVALACVILAGCTKNNASQTPATTVLRLATTTSTRDSGLLEELLPDFEQRYDCRVDTIAVGTGAALRLGEEGEADVVMVHAREAEEAFMKAGHGIRHEEFMYNEFVILGPSDDPAMIRSHDPVAAMQRIVDGKQRFVSRGDDSGTHKRELQLWEAAGRQPIWSDYIECGQGMGPTLMMADEKQAYVLADMGTYLQFQQQIELVPLVTDSEWLHNAYAVIVVNPDKHARVNASLADAFVEYLIAKETQQAIAAYRLAGRPLFYPTRIAPSDQAPAD